MLSKFSVNKAYTVVVAVVLILILGTVSFINLSTDLLPSIDLPYVVMMTSYPGASPEEVEMIVTRPIEQATATVNNIKNINSISRENSSLVILEFNSDTNMDSATIEINSMLDLIKPAWDNYPISSPMIMRLNPEMLPIMVSALDVEGMDVHEISELVREEIIPELEGVNGVASVQGVGLLEEKIEILLDGKKIEGINERILAAVDSELSKVEAKLMEGKRELEAGREKLAREEEKYVGKLQELEGALPFGQGDFSLAEEKIRAGKEELNKARLQMEDGLEEIRGNRQKLEEAEEALTALGLLLRAEDKMQLETIRQGLEQLSQKEEEIKLGLEEVNEQLARLEEGEAGLGSDQDLLAGRMQLSMEMDRAKLELSIGEEKLNEKIKEFEEAKDLAFKKASLEGKISREMISKILGAQNFAMPAGYVSGEEGNRHVVKVGDKFENISQLENLVLFDTGKDVIGKIYLRDLADISIRDNSENIYARVNGNNAIMLVFNKQSNYLTSNVSKDIRARALELSSKHENLTFTELMDQGIYIDIVIDSVLKNILYGGILAILVLILFLRDLKPTFIIAVSIPISIIFALAMMYFTGVSINIISLSGLALGVGMLVDNSIVAIENIYRLRKEGKSGKDAAIEGANEIAGAIIASTLTTASVFLPIVFVHGLSKQLFVDMGLTIAYSLLASLLVALSLVPAMAATMLKKTTSKSSGLYDKFTSFYEGLLRVSLKHRWLLIILVTGLFALSLYGGLSKGTSFIPEMDAPQMSMDISLTENSPSKNIREMADLVMDRIGEIDEIETIGAFQGSPMGGLGGTMIGGSDGESVSMYLLLNEDMDFNNENIKGKILELTEDMDLDININANTMDLSALTGTGLEVEIKGRDMEGLYGIAKDMSLLLEETEGTGEIYDGIDEELTELRIHVDKEKAIARGLTVAQVFGHMTSVIGEANSSTILTMENKDYPVIVLSKEDENIRAENLGETNIRGEIEGEVRETPLGDIAEISEEEGINSIRRDGQERLISVRADIDAGYNIGLVSRDFERKLADYKLPEGYRIEISGEKEMIDESLGDLSKMLLLAIVFIYLIMVAQFQSLLSPFIILFTIPLAFTGGLLALIFTGNEISLIAMLGFLVLSGIVVNNGIVFVDYTNQLRAGGMNKTEALVLAGKTRMRPILMTAITTIFGLLTLSVGFGVGAEMIQPLAIVSIGGLSYATILTLFVVPAMYHLLHRDKAGKDPRELEV